MPEAIVEELGLPARSSRGVPDGPPGLLPEDPAPGDFWFRVMKGEECLGTFRPGDTQAWDGTPFLASVEGETEPAAIVEKLGIPRSFVARSI
jgi:hypothetical protein